MPVAVSDVDGEIDVPGDHGGHFRQIGIDVRLRLTGRNLDRRLRTPGAERLLQQRPTAVHRLRRTERQHVIRPAFGRQKLHQGDRRKPRLGSSIPQGVARRLRRRSQHRQQQMLALRHLDLFTVLHDSTSRVPARGSDPWRPRDGAAAPRNRGQRRRAAVSAAVSQAIPAVRSTGPTKRITSSKRVGGAPRSQRPNRVTWKL